MEDIREFAGVRLGPGTLYGAITRLEKRGWIQPVKSEDRRQPYSITGAGRALLEEELKRMNKVASAAARRLKPA